MNEGMPRSTSERFAQIDLAYEARTETVSRATTLRELSAALAHMKGVAESVGSSEVAEFFAGELDKANTILNAFVTDGSETVLPKLQASFEAQTKNFSRAYGVRATVEKILSRALNGIEPAPHTDETLDIDLSIPFKAVDIDLSEGNK